MESVSHLLQYEEMYQIAIVILLVFVLLVMFYHRDKFTPTNMINKVKTMLKPDNFTPSNIVAGVKGMFKKDHLVPGFKGAYDPSVLNPKPLSLAGGMFGVPAKEGYMCPKYNNNVSWPHTWPG